MVLNGFFLEFAHGTQQVESQAKEIEPATAELISNVKTIRGGEPFWVALKISLQPGWHVYWRNPGDSGIATDIEWSLPEGFTAGPIQWLPPQRFELENIVTFGYANEAYHLVQITPPETITPGTVTLKAKATWLACKDSCTPGMADLSLNLEGSPDKSEANDHKALFDELVQELPVQYPTHGGYKIGKDKIQFRLPNELGMNNDVISLYLIPYDKDLIKYDAPHWLKKDDHYWIDLPKDPLNTSTNDFKAIVQMNDLQEKRVINTEVLFDYKEEAIVDSTYAEHENIFMLLLFAFLGGLILNAMPCVFPILSLKTMSIVRESGHHREKIYLEGIFYLAGVVVTFISMACLLILIKEGGQSVGWGFQMQNPYFIFLMIDLLYFMGLSLSGVVHLPMMFGNTVIGDPYSKHDRYSNFWIGILAVLVATPCTGPFMGVAIGYALTQDVLSVLIIFLALALGFASPFLLLSLYTPILKIFPKPGRWMETLKEFMAYPMYLTVAWLLWVLVQQVGDRGLFAALISIILIRFSIWFGKRVNFTNPFFKRVCILLGMIFALYPITYLEKIATHIQVQMKDFSKKELIELRTQGKPVFVYATAAWCITCKVNELALTSNATDEFFNQNDVTLMKADWTNQNPEITEFLSEYGRSGVPLYVYYPPNKKPVILPQILTESIVREAITGGDEEK